MLWYPDTVILFALLSWDQARKDSRGPAARLVRLQIVAPGAHCYGVVMIIDNSVYVEGRRTVPATLEESFRARHDPESFACIVLHEPQQEELDSIVGELGVDKTLIESAIRHPHRARVQLLGNVLYVCLAYVRYPHGKEPLEIGWISAFLDESLVVALSFGEGLEALKNVRQHMENEPERLWRGTQDVLREIVGEVFDGYDEAAESLDGDIAQTEREVFDGKSTAARRIHALTRVVVELHQAIEPLAEALERFLESADNGTREVLSQARHRIRRVSEKLDGFQDLLSSLLGLNLTMVGQKISAWGAILIVPTVFAGIFGMNANHNLCGWIIHDCRYSLEFLVTFFIGIPAVVLYLVFKRSGWL